LRRANQYSLRMLRFLLPKKKLEDMPGKHDFEYNSRFYAKDALYPKEIVRVSGLFNFDRYQSILLHVIPSQFNPVSKRLIGYGEVIVIIHLNKKRMARRAQMPRASGYEPKKAACGNLLLNPESRIGERLGMAETPRKAPFHGFIFTTELVRSGPESLIIYAEMFQEAAEKLAKLNRR